MPVLRIVISAAGLALSIVASAGAETVPATVRACIGLADAAQRLACYDREVARLIAPADTFTQAPAIAAPGAPVVPAAPLAPAVSSTAPAAAPVPAPASAPRHLTAKVSAVHRAGDSLTVTLDNGNVWEQSAPATSQLNLRPGDVVQLDREVGSWFLTNRYGDNIQVRLRQP
jgi:hypothetical protein